MDEEAGLVEMRAIGGEQHPVVEGHGVRAEAAVGARQVEGGVEAVHAPPVALHLSPPQPLLLLSNNQRLLLKQILSK